MALKRVLVQAGHVAPREPGFEAGTGTVREQEFARAVQIRLSRLLKTDGRFDTTLCGGDIPDGWTGDLFLSLHGDGSSSRRSSGYCYGFPPDSLKSAAFANIHAVEFEKVEGHPPHRKDNYTGALRSYYGWRRVNAPVKVLVEHGFLTNPSEQTWMFNNIPQIADAHYRAVCRLFGWRPRYATTRPKKKPTVVVRPPGVLPNTVSTAEFRVDVDVPGRPEKLRDQNPESPAVAGRIEAWKKRFPSVSVLWKRK